MKFFTISLLLLVFAIYHSWAQCLATSYPVVRIRCGATTSLAKEPLVIVDGVPVEFKGLGNIDPANVESIIILKGMVAAALYGAEAADGVILITSKEALIRKFIVRDLLSGERISRATLSFISIDGKDSLKMAANDSGVVMTDKLRSPAEYKMTISSTGYKPYAISYKNGSYRKEQEILMTRDIPSCQEVVVKQTTCLRHHICCGYCINYCRRGSNAMETEANKNAFRLYPNPVQKGSSIILQTILDNDDPIQVRIVTLDGRLVHSQTREINKGTNRINIPTDSRWASGIYFVQLLDENGKLVGRDKMIVQ